MYIIIWKKISRTFSLSPFTASVYFGDSGQNGRIRTSAKAAIPGNAKARGQSSSPPNMEGSPINRENQSEKATATWNFENFNFWPPVLHTAGTPTLPVKDTDLLFLPSTLPTFPYPKTTVRLMQTECRCITQKAFNFFTLEIKQKLLKKMFFFQNTYSWFLPRV